MILAFAFSLITSLALLLPIQGKVLYDPVTVPTAPKAIVKLAETQLAPQTPLELIGFPVAPVGTYANTYAYGNCTAYVAGRKQVPNSWGNANTWALRASQDGYTVSPVPIVGSVAQTSAYGLGHVAIVEAVNVDSVTVSEMNWDGLGVIDTRTTLIRDWVYIYT